jgi:hypothetical protein
MDNGTNSNPGALSVCAYQGGSSSPLPSRAAAALWPCALRREIARRAGGAAEGGLSMSKARGTPFSRPCAPLRSTCVY